MAGEPVADLEVTHAELVATEIEAAEVPRLVDELPLFALAASISTVGGVRGGRGSGRDGCAVSTRSSTGSGLSAPTSAGTPTASGSAASPPARAAAGSAERARGDHRIAMLAAVTAFASSDVEIEGAETVIPSPGSST